MTFLERLIKDHPEWTKDATDEAIKITCPSGYGYEPESNNGPRRCEQPCDYKTCWNREMQNKKSKFDIPPLKFNHLGTERLCTANVEVVDSPECVTPVIKDSGARREFETGAVRDIQEGKGRCDLLPLDVVGDYMSDMVLASISSFQHEAPKMCDGGATYLDQALDHFYKHWDDGKTKASREEMIKQCRCTMFLEVSKHFEEGAKKYGEYNWQKGIPTHCYIDSAVRHYLKYLRGDKDEPHDRAFVWNILCCIWTCIHKPELNDYAARATCMETKELFENAINAMKRYSEDTQPKKEEKTDVPKITGNPDSISTFTIKVTMKERWVDHFCSMLQRMESYGKSGHSAIIGFFSDGDGDFHPHFEMDRTFEAVSGHEQKERIPVEVVFDAG